MSKVEHIRRGTGWVCGYRRGEVRNAYVLAVYVGVPPKGYYDAPESVRQLERDGFLPLDWRRYQAMEAVNAARATRGQGVQGRLF
jgi:hypothetical protein